MSQQRKCNFRWKKDNQYWEDRSYMKSGPYQTLCEDRVLHMRNCDKAGYLICMSKYHQMEGSFSALLPAKLQIFFTQTWFTVLGLKTIVGNCYNNQVSKKSAMKPGLVYLIECMLILGAERLTISSKTDQILTSDVSGKQPTQLMRTFTFSIFTTVTVTHTWVTGTPFAKLMMITAQRSNVQP